MEVEERVSVNFRRFTITDGDIDRRVSERVISGRLTKARYKAIDRLCRRMTYRTHCGCEHDCCGSRMEFEYKQNAVVITLTQHFNY